MGTFHRRDRDDGFRLPVISSYQSCTIIVSLKTTATDNSTWEAIELKIGSIISECSVGEGANARTGGFSYVGDQEQIVLRVVKVTPWTKSWQSFPRY